MSAGYAAAAAALHELGDRMATLADRAGLSRPDPGIRLTVMPGQPDGHPGNEAAVGLVAAVLLGGSGHQRRQPYGSDQEIYAVDLTVGGVSVTVQAIVPGLAPWEMRAQLAARDAELERLRAELADRSVDAGPWCTCCRATPATPGVCCSSHARRLCHACYRRTHWVEVCVPGCEACAREDLDPGTAVTR